MGQRVFGLTDWYRDGTLAEYAASAIVQWVRDGRLRTNLGNVSILDDAVAAFNPTAWIKGKTIIRVRP